MICPRCKKWSKIKVKAPAIILACPLCGNVLEASQAQEAPTLTLFAWVKAAITQIRNYFTKG